jgi:hypothetical protein
MGEVLYAPNRERVVTTNAWAFLHWLRMERGVGLDGWAGLQAWSAQEPAAFGAAIAAFSGASPPPPSRDGRKDAGALAHRLLHQDLRPNDRLLVVESDEADPLSRAAEARASVLVTSADVLAKSAFQRPDRLDLAELRTIIAIGGPMAPEARRRIYAWVKADVMLLACAGETYWGNPLEAVLAQPPATPGFLTPRPSVRPLR